MRNDASLLGVGNIGVLLSENLRIAGVLDVVKPALNGNVVGIGGKIAEYEHGAIWRRRAPAFEFDVGRRSNLPERIEALRNHFEDASIVQVVPERFIEGAQQF